MNEQPGNFDLRALLDEAAEAPSVPRDRLRLAREQALAALPAGQTAEALVTIPALATSGGRGAGGGPAGALLTRYLLPAAIVLAALLGWQHWQQSMRDSAEIEGIGRIDADILKSNLPVDALIDPEFKAYLRKVGNPSEGTSEAGDPQTDHGQTQAGERR
jgi:hypothetical protein